MRPKGGGRHQSRYGLAVPWTYLTLAVFLLWGGTASAKDCYVVGVTGMTTCDVEAQQPTWTTCDVREVVEASRAWAYHSARSLDSVQRLREWEVLAMAESRWRRAVATCNP